MMLKNWYFANNPAQITTTWFIQKDRMIDENNGIDTMTKINDHDDVSAFRWFLELIVKCSKKLRCYLSIYIKLFW